MTVTVARDLRTLYGQARDQGSRPTCCAFACSDLHAACRLPWVELSCEFAFYCGARRQGTSAGRGVYLHHMLDAIEHDGQPHEAAWPYSVAALLPPAQWAPPKDLGRLYHGRGIRTVWSPSEIRASIDADQPVGIVLRLSDAFYLGPNADGVIDSPEPPDPARVHAVIAVGRGTMGADELVLIRNSWGVGWGLGGHAWLADRYLTPRIIETTTMTRVL